MKRQRRFKKAVAVILLASMLSTPTVTLAEGLLASGLVDRISYVGQRIEQYINNHKAHAADPSSETLPTNKDDITTDEVPVVPEGDAGLSEDEIKDLISGAISGIPGCSCPDYSGTISGLNTAVGNLESALSTVNGEIAALTLRMTGAEEDIEALAEEVDKLTEIASLLSGLISSINTHMAKIESAVSSNDGKTVLSEIINLRTDLDKYVNGSGSYKGIMHYLKNTNQTVDEINTAINGNGTDANKGILAYIRDLHIAFLQSPDGVSPSLVTGLHNTNKYINEFIGVDASGKETGAWYEHSDIMEEQIFTLNSTLGYGYVKKTTVNPDGSITEEWVTDKLNPVTQQQRTIEYDMSILTEWLGYQYKNPDWDDNDPETQFYVWNNDLSTNKTLADIEELLVSQQHSYRVAHLQSLNNMISQCYWKPYSSEIPFINDLVQTTGKFVNTYNGYWDTTVPTVTRNRVGSRYYEILGYDIDVRYEGIVAGKTYRTTVTVGNSKAGEVYTQPEEEIEEMNKTEVHEVVTPVYKYKVEQMPEYGLSWLDAVTILYKALGQEVITNQIFYIRDESITAENSPTVQGLSNIVDLQGYNAYVFSTRANTMMNVMGGTEETVRYKDLYWDKALSDGIVPIVQDADPQEMMISNKEFWQLAAYLMQMYGEPEMNSTEIMSLLQVYGASYPIQEGTAIADAWAYLKARGVLAEEVSPNDFLNLEYCLDVCMRIKDRGSRLNFKEINITLLLEDAIVDTGVYPLSNITVVNNANYVYESQYEYENTLYYDYIIDYKSGNLNKDSVVFLCNKDGTPLALEDLFDVHPIIEPYYYEVEAGKTVECLRVAVPKEYNRNIYLCLTEVENKANPPKLTIVCIPTNVYGGGYYTVNSVAAENSQASAIHNVATRNSFTDRDSLVLVDIARAGVSLKDIDFIEAAADANALERVAFFFDYIFAPQTAYAATSMADVTQITTPGRPSDIIMYIKTKENGAPSKTPDMMVSSTMYKKMGPLNRDTAEFRALTLMSLCSIFNVSSYNLYSPKVLGFNDDTDKPKMNSWGSVSTAYNDGVVSAFEDLWVPKGVKYHLIGYGNNVLSGPLNLSNDAVAGDSPYVNVYLSLPMLYALCVDERFYPTFLSFMPTTIEQGNVVVVAFKEWLNFIQRPENLDLYEEWAEYSSSLQDNDPKKRYTAREAQMWIRDFVNALTPITGLPYNINSANALATQWVYFQTSIIGQVGYIYQSPTNLAFSNAMANRINNTAARTYVETAVTTTIDESDNQVIQSLKWDGAIKTNLLMNRSKIMYVSWSHIASLSDFVIGDRKQPKVDAEGCVSFYLRDRGRVIVNNHKKTIQVGTIIYTFDKYDVATNKEVNLYYFDKAGNLYIDYRAILGVSTKDRFNDTEATTENVLEATGDTVYNLKTGMNNTDEIEMTSAGCTVTGAEQAFNSYYSSYQNNSTKGFRLMSYYGEYANEKIILSLTSVIPTANWVVVEDSNTHNSSFVYVWYNRAAFRPAFARGEALNLDLQQVGVDVFNITDSDMSKITNAELTKQKSKAMLMKVEDVTLHDYICKELGDLPTASFDNWPIELKLSYVNYVDLFDQLNMAAISPEYVLRKYAVGEWNCIKGTGAEGESPVVEGQVGYLKDVGYVYVVPSSMVTDDYLKGAYTFKVSDQASPVVKYCWLPLASRSSSTLDKIINYNVNYYGTVVNGGTEYNTKYGEILIGSGDEDLPYSIYNIDRQEVVNTSGVSNWKLPDGAVFLTRGHHSMTSPAGVYYYLAGNKPETILVKNVTSAFASRAAIYYGTLRIIPKGLEDGLYAFSAGFDNNLINIKADSIAEFLVRDAAGRYHFAILPNMTVTSTVYIKDIEILEYDLPVTEDSPVYQAIVYFLDSLDKWTSLAFFILFEILPLIGVAYIVILIGLSTFSPRMIGLINNLMHCDIISVLTLGRRTSQEWKWQKVAMPMMLAFISMTLLYGPVLLQVIRIVSNLAYKLLNLR